MEEGFDNEDTSGDDLGASGDYTGRPTPSAGEDAERPAPSSRAHAQGWISMEGKWPADQQVVIAAWPDGTVCPAVFSLYKGKPYWEYTDGETVPYTVYPTYWMPLPDPPSHNPAQR